MRRRVKRRVKTGIEKAAWEALVWGSAVVAGLAMRKLAREVWWRSRGEEPPDDSGTSDDDWIDGIVWTAVLGAAVGASRVLARRGAATTWRLVTGDEPPDEDYA